MDQGSQPDQANGAFRRIVALCLALCLLPALALSAAKEERPEAVVSPVHIPGFTAPDVPEGERVEDDYFKNAILLGDSLASGLELYEVFPAMEIVYKTGLSPRSIAIKEKNFKLNGENATLVEYLKDKNPEVLYIWLGLNGVEGSGSSLVLANYHIMLNLLIEALPRTVIYLLELTPVRDDAAKKHSMLTNANVDRFNEGLYELATEHNVFLLQYHDIMLNEDGILKRPYCAGDGYHLLKAGHEAVVEYLYTHTVPLNDIWYFE